MNDWLSASGVLVASFLVGGIPFGLIFGFLVRGVDIREHGSRNIGATNAARVIGWKWFPLVLLLDALKGFAPVVLAALIPSALDLPLFAALGALLGHFYSVYLKFRGGKGVATGLGVVLALTGTPVLPLPAFCALGVFALVLAFSRMISAASVVASLSLPVWYWLFTRPETFDVGFLPRFVFITVMSAFIVVKHRANLRRIAAGTEPRLGRKMPEKDDG